MAHSFYCTYSPFENKSLPSRPISDVTAVLEEKPFSSLLSAKSLCSKDQSLASVFTPRRNSLKELSAKFLREAKHRRSGDLPIAPHDEDQDTVEPPTKRRRFQRRNSKTAAMLFSSLSSINPSDYLDDDKSEEPVEDSWDGGLEIAEDLVRQLKLRRMSQSFQST